MISWYHCDDIVLTQARTIGSGAVAGDVVVVVVRELQGVQV